MAAPKKRIRDNTYYLQRLKADHPAIYSDLRAGKIETIAEARRLAGLGGSRTRLHELKNAWLKATPAERREFLSFIKTVAKAVPVFDADGRLMPWARDRVVDIMGARQLKSGDLSAELGLYRLDSSVMSAVKSGWRLKPSTAAALEAWIHKHAAL